ncbi:MAG TPA: copper resistance protein CopC, partial [Chloroflexia bacterium]|nr:copper resistance protein CopC [Chloroflexia bacterium]
MTRNASTNARRTLAALLALFSLLWLLPASTTLAHSKLLRTSPAAGSILAAPPTEIQLFLSESVGLEFSSLTLYDRARREQPLGPLRRVGEDDTTVSAAVLGPVPSGTYTVVWRVLSGVDGHLTAGSFAFRVRASDAAGTSGTPEPEEPVTPIEAGPQTPFEGAAADPDPLRWAIRGIILAGSVLLLGVPLLALLIVEPTVRERDLTGSPLARIVDKRGGRLGAVTAVVVLVALVIDLVLQVAEIGASGISQALGRGDLALLVINTTRYGVSWAVKVAASTALAGIMLAIWLRRRPGGHSLWEISVAAASLLLLAQSLGSHAAASNAGLTLLGVPLPVVTDWLHLVTVGAWVGGLGYMALVLFPALRASGLSGEERRAFLGRLIPRFSTLAIISVSLLAATGLYSVIVHSTDLSAILGSEYGQVLALKIALFVLLIIVGGVNLRRLTPLLKARPAGRTSSPHLDNSANVVNVPDAGNVAEAGSWGERELGPVRRLGRNVRLEVVLSVFALLCAGGLTLLPPPSGTAPGTLAASPVEQPTMSPLEPPETAVASSSPVPQDPGALPTPGPATAASTAGGYNFSFTIVPSIEGDDVTLDIGRSIAASPPLTDVAKVLFKVTPQDVDAGSTSYEAQRLGDAGPAKQTWHAREAIL